MKEIKRGDIYLADLGDNIGSVVVLCLKISRFCVILLYA